MKILNVYHNFKKVREVLEELLFTIIQIKLILTLLPETLVYITICLNYKISSLIPQKLEKCAKIMLHNGRKIIMISVYISP